MHVLGIDTSCDDTAAAVVDDDFAILSNVVASQEEHLEFGGVVPELASRAHLRALVPVVRTALSRAGIELDDVDGIAVTHGPGLLGSLLVGVSFAKSLAYASNTPLVGVNHLEGHIWSSLAVDASLLSRPFLALIVSGGHSELVLVRKFGDYLHLGGTRDDAAGEAFDKVAKLLGLGYPGGPAIEKLASSGDGASGDGASDDGASSGTSPSRADGDLRFPVARAGDFDLSFSGLKTAVRYHLDQHPPEDEAARAAVARAFEEAVVEALVGRVMHAVSQHPVEHVVLCGGVACNERLATRLRSGLATRNCQLVRPAKSLCTDNGAMIAYVGMLHLKSGRQSALTLGAQATLEEIGWGRGGETPLATGAAAAPVVPDVTTTDA
jgi:N6-L-threonylcarbamoyladenine synthase